MDFLLIKTSRSSLVVLQKASMSSPANGTTVQTTVFTAATVNRLTKMASSFFMVTGEFTTMTSSQLFEPSTKPSKRYRQPEQTTDLWYCVAS